MLNRLLFTLVFITSASSVAHGSATVQILRGAKHAQIGWSKVVVSDSKKTGAISFEGKEKAKVKIASGLAKQIQSEITQLIWDLKFKSAKPKIKCEPLAELTVKSTGDRFIGCSNVPEHANRIGRLISRIDKLAKTKN